MVLQPPFWILSQNDNLESVGNGAKDSKLLVPGSMVQVVSKTFAEFVGSLKKLNCKTGKGTVGFPLFAKES
ncbi:hypothetical protein CRYUN_Cryun09bG0013100 [Craigia yunnanensis]